MEYVPNKVYTGKVTEVKKFEGQIDSKKFEKDWKDPTTGAVKHLVSYSVSVKFDIFGDQWFSGFVNESKKTPGTPAVWEGMEMFFTITEKTVEKEGSDPRTFYNFQKLSESKAKQMEKDSEIENLKAQLAAAKSGEVVEDVNPEDIPF